MKPVKRQNTGTLAPLSRAWSPMRQLSRLQSDIDRLLGEPFGFGEWLPTTPLFEAGWAPAVDVFEDEDNVMVKAELLGLP